MIDFVSNRAHMLQNAGIGGFTAARFLTDRYGRSLEDLLRDFVPDIAFIVLGDIYRDKGDDFQARATYRSIVDGYSPADDGIVDEARQRIESLNQ